MNFGNKAVIENATAKNYETAYNRDSNLWISTSGDKSVD